MTEGSTSTTPQTAEERIDAVLDQETTYETYSDILLNAGVKDADESVLAFYVRRLTSGDLAAAEFPAEVIKEFGVSQEVAGQVAKAVAARVLAPLVKDLPFALDILTRDPSARPSNGLGRDDTEKREVAIGGGVKKEDDTQLDEELEDIKQQKAAVIEKKGPLDVPGIVKEICENPLFAFEDPTLQERCTKLIESRVRDVRTPEQTRAQLEKAVESGGLGVSGRRLADMLALVEGRVTAFQGNLSQEEQRKRIDQLASAPDKVQLAKNEETLLTKRYVELTGKVPSTHIAPAAPSVSRTSVAISAHHEQIAREGKIDTAKVKEAVEGAKQTVVQPRPKVSPSMQEVTFEKRLSGPIDELRSLTLTDFRRLSKDPTQAATKVKDKVDLMEDQGYDKKVEAVQAWRSSGLNQIYVSLTREAVLTGTSVVELLSRKRVAGEETLSDEELKAVMKLNAELRF